MNLDILIESFYEYYLAMGTRDCSVCQPERQTEGEDNFVSTLIDFNLLAPPGALGGVTV